MKIKLYTNVYEDANEKKLNYYDLEISGKIISYTVVPKNSKEYNEDVFRFEQRKFRYSHDDSFLTIFPNLKLNTKIKIEPYSIQGCTDIKGFEHQDFSDIAHLEGYCHLNYFQQFILNYRFKKLWLQQRENLKWTLKLIVGILTALGSLSFLFLQ